jgi:sulfur-oxidizing protein SoxZ
MAGKMRTRAQLGDDGVTTVKVLMKHPMETGMRKGSDGNKIPAHFIEIVEAKLGDQSLFTAMMGPAVSKDPYLAFETTVPKKGDKIQISWKDNQGQSQSTDATVR